MNIFLTLLEDTFWAGLAAVGFAILFNVPRRALLGAALCGGLAYLIRTVLVIHSGWLGIEAATWVGATTVGFLGVLFGRRWHVPAIVFIVPGVIPMLPGSRAFSTMIDLVRLTTTTSPVIDQILLAEITVNSIKTVIILCAIAGGIAMPSLLLRRHQPMS